MSEFEEKLNAILSNPDALAQVASLAQSLNLGGSQESGGGGESSAEHSAGEGGAAPSGGGLGGLGALTGLGDLLGKLDPKLLERLLPLAGELFGDGGGDERMQLLYALRPFLKPERQDKVERAVKTARFIHVGKKLLSVMGESDV